MMSRALLWRLGVAALCIGGLVALSSSEHGPEDDPWISIAFAALPFSAGLLIGRLWAFGLALSPLLLYALDPDTGELAAWWVLSVSIIAFAVMIGAGLAVRWLVDRARRSRNAST